MVFDPQGENDAYPQDYESDEPRQAYLYDITNDRAFTLSGSTETIGRESRNSIVIPDINVSRSHAEIRQDESGAWIITDLGSTNGTFVNGRQIKSSPLYDADRIIIGTTNIEFQLI
jgi:pSer/pThr/pTyr-binding forkhead associated (FHA) protein